MLTVTVVDLPYAAPVCFSSTFGPGALESAALATRLVDDPAAPVQRSEPLRGAVRDFLRRGGYKPTGRGKPAAEYLAQAAERGALGSINLAVDACNIASLHSGLPISVVDLDRAAEPLSIRLAGDESYVFNASGQTIDVAGLLCLFDAAGPCANAVKDSQRTKTHAGTTRTLSIVWSPTDVARHAEQTAAYYRSLLASCGVVTESVAVVR